MNTAGLARQLTAQVRMRGKLFAEWYENKKEGLKAMEVPYESVDMVNNFGFLGCCGVQELRNLRSITGCIGTKGVVQKIAESYSSHFINGTFLLFSQAHGGPEHNYGDKLLAFILEHKLGSVIKTSTRRNPNSGNNLVAYIWEVDRDKLAVWLAQNPSPPSSGKTVEPVAPVFATPMPIRSI